MDKVSRETRSKIMSAVKSKNTTPEIKLRKELWSKGLRYRIQYGKEKIDIAFLKPKIAIFVDGCFWHGCPIHSRLPKTNTAYWYPKLALNKERDLRKTALLEDEGWLVLRFWEHELDDINTVIDRITSALNNKDAI